MDGGDSSPGLTDGWEVPAKKNKDCVECELSWRNKAFLLILSSIFCVLYNKNSPAICG